MLAEAQDVHAAVRHLSPADYVCLFRVALEVKRPPACDPKALVADVIGRALLATAGQGSERWSTEQPFVEYLSMLLSDPSLASSPPLLGLVSGPRDAQSD